MAKELIVRIRDDITGEYDAEGESIVDVQTLKFGWLGREYEIDLSEESRREFSKLIEPYVEAGRAVSSKKRPETKAAEPNTSTATTRGDKQRRDGIRKWARDNGFQVGPYGKLPRDVVEAYDRAHRFGVSA